MSASAATPTTSISSAPSKKLPTTRPRAAPVSDHPRRVRVTPITERLRGRAGYGHRGEDGTHDVAPGHAAQLRVGREDQAVLEHGRHDALDVVGDHERAAEARGEGARGALQRERPAGARTEQEIGMAT